MRYGAFLGSLPYAKWVSCSKHPLPCPLLVSISLKVTATCLTNLKVSPGAMHMPGCYAILSWQPPTGWLVCTAFKATSVNLDILQFVQGQCNMPGWSPLLFRASPRTWRLFDAVRAKECMTGCPVFLSSPLTHARPVFNIFRVAGTCLRTTL